jgi:hypothetical protein
VKIFSRWYIILRVFSERQYIPQNNPDDARKLHQAQAMSKLRKVRGDLLGARLAALDAQLSLVEAQVSNRGSGHDIEGRVKRAAELCEGITECVAQAERLLFYVAGDSQ